MTIDPIVSLIAQFLMAGIFLNAALHKLKDQNTFRLVLADYGVAEALRQPASLLVLTSELFIAVTVILSLFFNLNMGMAAGLGVLGFYTCLLSYYYLNDRGIDCGCHFGDHPAPVGAWHIVRNLVLMCFAALYFVPQGARLMGWLDYATAIFAALMIGLSLVIIEIMKHNNNHFKIEGKTA